LCSSEHRLLLGGPLHHRPELEHPELALTDADAAGRGRGPVPRESSLIATAIRAQRRRAPPRDDPADAEVERLLHAQSVPASTGGRSSKSGTPCPGTYSPRCSKSSVVFGAIRTRTPLRCAVLDELEHRLLVEAALAEDDLVRPAPAQPRRQGPSPSGRERADDVVGVQPP
jgi:hypothetical protein